jgi:transposase, IS30 family
LERRRGRSPSGGFLNNLSPGSTLLAHTRGRLRDEAVRLAEGWTPEQISGWLKSGDEPRLRALGCGTIHAFIYRTGQKAEALWRYLTRRHKRRRPRRARPSRDAIKLIYNSDGPL